MRVCAQQKQDQIKQDPSTSESSPQQIHTSRCTTGHCEFDDSNSKGFRFQILEVHSLATGAFNNLSLLGARTAGSADFSQVWRCLLVLPLSGNIRRSLLGRNILLEYDRRKKVSLADSVLLWVQGFNCGWPFVGGAKGMELLQCW